MRYPINRACSITAVRAPEVVDYLGADLRSLVGDEGFEVVNDYGQTRAARNVCARFGDAAGNVAFRAACIAKRVYAAAPSTELFCRSV